MGLINDMGKSGSEESLLRMNTYLAEHNIPKRRGRPVSSQPGPGTVSEKILALLRAEKFLTHAECARRLGANREMVRQVSKKYMGQVGEARRLEALQTVIPSCKTLNEETVKFVSAAAGHGLTAKPFMKISKLGRCNSQGVRVGEFRLIVKIATEYPRGGFYRIVGSRKHGYDFCCYLLPDGRFSIVPWAALPKQSTCLATNGRWQRRCHRDPKKMSRIVGEKGFNLHSFIENWSQLLPPSGEIKHSLPETCYAD